MSEAVAFDTHRYVKRLTGSGFTEQQAETLAEEQIAFLNANLATKSDIESLRQETKSDIESLRQETKADIESLRQETKADIESLRQETKADIESLRQETKVEISSVKASIESLRQETKAEISSVKADLVKWMFGVSVAQTTIILAFIALVLSPSP